MAACANCGHGSVWHAGMPGERGTCIPYNKPDCECPGFNFQNPTVGNHAGQPAPTQAEPTKEATP